MIGAFRSVDFTCCRSEYGVALGELFACQKQPTVAWVTCPEDVIFIGSQLRTTKVNVKKARADGVNLRRQNTRGRVMMMSNYHQLVIMIGISNWRQYEAYANHARNAYINLCQIIRRGGEILGAPTAVELGAKTKHPWAYHDCFQTIETGDLCATQSGQKFSASTYLLREDWFQMDTIINISGQSNLQPYLEHPDLGLEPTFLAKEIGRDLETHQSIDAYKQAFDEAYGLEEKPLTQSEHHQLKELVESKYITDKWIYKKWPVS